MSDRDVPPDAAAPVAGRTVPSPTAQRVAVLRLTAARVGAPFGDPDSDLALHRDVAGEPGPDPPNPPDGERMRRFVAGRTAFFDRVVVNAIDRGVSQILAVGAGYDGRSLRYAAPGVRWFELDHPVTQADKRARLQRLGIDAGGVTFIGLELAAGDVRAAVIDSGWEPDAGSLLLCEGVSIYLTVDVLARTLGALRALAGPGTRLAISLPRPQTGAGGQRLRVAIAALGEPAGNTLDGAGAGEVLTTAGWQAVQLSDRAHQAGFVVARPDWQTTPSGQLTASAVGRHLEQLFRRRGLDTLGAHLEATHGITVTRMAPLDAGVIAITRGQGSPWVARVFPAARPVAASRADAALLGWLTAAGFPSERPATAEPVSVHEGQAVLVTELVPGRRAGETAYRDLGALAGRLARLELPAWLRRPGGGWHHLVAEGDPTEEIAACARLLTAAAPRTRRSGAQAHAALTAALAGVQDCAGLPTGLIHPDLVPVNAVMGRDGALTLIDWAAAGEGPRLWSLAFLLWSAGQGSSSGVEAVMAGYASQVTLTADERSRLPAAVAARPTVFACWAAATGRRPWEEAAGELASIRERATGIAARAIRALG